MSGIKEKLFKLIYGSEGYEMIDEKNSIFVTKNEGVTRLKSGPITYSILSKDSLYTKSYYDYFIPLAYVYDKPKVLMIGIGGGTVLMQLRRLLGKKAELYGVDTNRKIVDFAKKHFIGDLNINIAVADGAAFVSKEKQKFDLVILDAYEGTNIPKQFLEDAFITDAAQSLKADGILAINTILGRSDMESYVGKLKKHFSVYELVLLPTHSNVLLVCSKRLDLDAIGKKINSNMPKTIDNRFLSERYLKLRPATPLPIFL